MKISILLPDLRGGGVERVRIILAHEFARVGHDVEFVIKQARGELLEEVQKNFAIVELATPRVRNVMPALIRYLRQSRPDALLAAMWPLTAIAPLAQRLSGHRCKVVVSEHNTLSQQYCGWGKFHRATLCGSAGVGYRLAHARVAVSDGVAWDIASLSRVSRSAFTVIHNPVRPFAGAGAGAVDRARGDEFWSGPCGARILTVGSMKPQKNHPLLLRAFARLSRTDARLMFVGDGAGRNTLEVLAKELGVAERVIFVGFQRDPVQFYQTADLFVLSSDYEGFGNVLVEALASGTPVVSTDCPSGPSEILEGGRFGRLVPVGDEAALFRAMQTELNTPPDPDYLRARAADFSPVIAAQKYLDLIEPEDKLND
ncbi:MAG: Glycosyltransferase [Halomonas sp. HL-93]|nr:MAG: Glycosyltransferase [Halomonas sp. HL-93]